MSELIDSGLTVGQLEQRLAAQDNVLAKIAASVTTPKTERNTEGWGYIAACVLATIALYFGVIDQIVWGVVVLGDSVAYGLGRVQLKK